MITNNFRFEFQPSVDLTEAEMTLHLALYAVEGLFGEARVRLEIGYEVDAQKRVLVVNADGEISASLVQVYTRLLIREFGEDGFHVRRIDAAFAETPNLETSAQRDEAVTAAA